MASAVSMTFDIGKLAFVCAPDKTAAAISKATASTMAASTRAVSGLPKAAIFSRRRSCRARPAANACARFCAFVRAMTRIIPGVLARDKRENSRRGA
jgi:hypothetical protein